MDFRHIRRVRNSDTSENPENDSARYVYTTLHDAYRSVVPKAVSPPIRSNSLGHKAAKGLKVAITSVDMINTFCNDNLGYIQTISAQLLSINVTSRDIENFVRAVHILVEGLEEVAIVFPFTGAAVVAFKLVMESNVKRKENNAKVLIIKAQIGYMMTALFQLKEIQDPKATDSKDVSIETRMSELMSRIERDIKTTGAACDHYSKKNALVRTLKARVYEDRLASHADIFTKHREEFQFLLSLYTALGVQSANHKLNEVTDQLKSIENKLDDVHAIFRHLDSPHERDLRNFIDERGGPDALLNNDFLLAEVLEKGEDMDESDLMGHKRRSTNLADLKADLLRELEEDLDATLQKNFDIFDRKLEMQHQQLLDAQRQQENIILTEIRAGFLHERIKHEDMREIWKEMGWKGSVKARHFVLALRDYFVEKSAKKDPANVESGNPELNNPVSDHVAPDWDPESEDDRWTHSYISVAHVQSILEAIDDDATGFITIKEVNEFTSSRPTGWTLPMWIAFWAVGWQTSIDRYKAQIYGLLEQLISLARIVHIDNRARVDEYLTDPVFNDLERLLRATKSPNCMIPDEVKLIQYVDAYTTEEERKLEDKLKSIAYELDGPATVSLVTGPGRIERFLFPLVYLILKQQVQIMYHARTHVLDGREILDMKETLIALFNVVHERVEGLVAILKQGHANLKEQLEYFAFGMFSLSYNHSSRDPKNNTILTWISHNRRAKPQYFDLSAAAPAKSVFRHDFALVVNPAAENPNTKTWHLGIRCDSCRNEIHGSRFICLTCIKEDFAENIDLFDAVILDAELALAIPKSQTVANQVEDHPPTGVISVSNVHWRCIIA
ncbi:hypothetical protein LENED_004297 [Lentinula edodes]|uniref:EF-hand domain-containing protein n=1 Tax=Lentinula edodes TaxID=5353 RepID=A0A1Q3E639_LENED|nr:hypothetical protein LENED_004297 [Lentinula edodes]